MFMRGKGRIIFLFLLFVIGMLLTVSVGVWTGIWSKQALKNFTMEQYMTVYLLISLISSFWIIVRDKCFAKTMMANANQLHDGLVRSMLNLNFRWAIEYNMGALGFKQSFDQKHVDGPINGDIHNLMDGAAFVLGGMIVLNYVYMGTMLIATILIFILFAIFIKKYTRTTKHIIRILAGKIAGLGGALGASINQMNSYRALHKTDILDKKF
jgi:ABC-type multidrug transport system fused ATPase/permease subunit